MTIKTFQDYLKTEREIQAQIDSLYELASQKFSEGDKAGQTQVYAQIDKLQAKKEALVNPEEDQVPENAEELDIDFI